MRVQLGEVAQRIGVRGDPRAEGIDRFVAGEHLRTDDLRVDSGQVTPEIPGPAFTTIFEPGAVLYGTRRTYLRKVGVADFKGVSANTTLALGVLGNQMLADYLPWLMSGPRFVEFSIRESKGSVNPFINWSDIARFEFNLPSLNEQRRVVEVMRAVDAYVYSASATVSAVRLAATVSATSLNVEHTTTLCSMAKITTGSFLRSDGRQANGEYPLVGASGQIGQTNQFNQSDKVVVVGRVGAPGAVHWTNGPAWVSDNAFVVTPHDYEDFWFLVAVLESQDWWREQSGSSQKLLTMPQLRGVQVPQVNAEARRAVASTRVLLESTFIKAELAENAAYALRNSLLQELIG